MKRWSHRCATCGNPRHFLPFYVRGWLAWHLFRWWPLRWGLPPFLATAGDYLFDHRGCHHAETFEDTDQMRRALGR